MFISRLQKSSFIQSIIPFSQASQLFPSIALQIDKYLLLLQKASSAALRTAAFAITSYVYRIEQALRLELADVAENHN
jgi:hypothetical protein